MSRRRADLEAIREALAPVNHLPLLTAEETVALCASAQAGDDAARAQLVRHNLRLVGKLALQWAGPLPAADLFQVGSVALMRAIKDWDPAGGASLATYATTWIKCYFGRAIDEQGLIVRLPKYLREIVRRVRARVAGGEREEFVIASEAEATGRNAELIRQALRGGTQRLIDNSTTGSTPETPLGLAVRREQPEHVQKLLNQLTDRTREVVNLTFGLAGNRPHTQAEVAKLYGLSRQRVGQIVERALATLRASAERKSNAN